MGVFSPKDVSNVGPMLLPAELSGVALVSIAWAFIYLAFTAFVNATKLAQGRLEKLRYWINRVHGNMHEQSPVFFTAIWAHAMIVSPVTATKLGWIILTLRAMYPITWALEGEPDPRLHGPGPLLVFFVSIPQHGINIYLLAASVATLNGVDVKSEMAKYFHGKFFGRFFGYDTLGCVAGYLSYLFVFMVWSKIGQPIFKRLFQAAEEEFESFDPNDRRTWSPRSPRRRA
mmetsp:Transcript_5463/g.10761  ORF Transcript_5463/g.10761 Transcript_5463/m.10761 type:complete len:230 (+) Transcript_5463:37-726(+)